MLKRASEVEPLARFAQWVDAWRAYGRCRDYAMRGPDGVTFHVEHFVMPHGGMWGLYCSISWPEEAAMVMLGPEDDPDWACAVLREQVSEEQSNG